MISLQRAKEIAENWKKRTPEDRERIREQADLLRAEAANWEPFHHENFRRFHQDSQNHAGGFAAYAYDVAEISPEVALAFKEWAIPEIEVAMLEELRSPAVRAWDRTCKLLDEIMQDSVVKANPEAVKAIQSWRGKIIAVALGYRSKDDVVPPVATYAKYAIKKHSAEIASMKNAKQRDWVQKEWESRPDKDQSKASFARQYVPLVKQRFGLQITAETIKKQWLPKSGE